MFSRHNLIKEEAPCWAFKKTYLVAFLTLMQLRQPKNVVENNPSAFSQKKKCANLTQKVSKVMSPVLTHLHACQIVGCVKTIHVLTEQCAK